MAGADYIGGIDATGNPVAPAQDDTGALQVPGDLPVAVAVPGDVGQDKAHHEIPYVGVDANAVLSAARPAACAAPH